MELKRDPNIVGMKANNLLLVILIILVCVAKGSAQQACPAPDNDWLPTDLGHGYFQYAPPAERAKTSELRSRSSRSSCGSRPASGSTS